MGLSDAEARSTVRVSLSRMTSPEEIDRVVAVLRDVVPRCARVASLPNRDLRPATRES